MTNVSVVIINREELLKYLSKQSSLPRLEDDTGTESEFADGTIEHERWLNTHEQKSPVLTYASDQQLADELTKRNIAHDKANQPFLGCATTKELLEELKVRAEIGGYAESVCLFLQTKGTHTTVPVLTVGEILKVLIDHGDKEAYLTYRTVDS